jgi:RimJ/RimL family protein N-acetyltransferase
MEKIGVFAFRRMDESSAREITRWRYDPPYDIYSFDPNAVEQTIRCFLCPQYQYYSVWKTPEELVGYCCFGEDGRVPGGDYTAEALDIDAGLRPDLTGQGLGDSFIRAALDFARLRFAPVCFRATVAAFNKRALTCLRQS